MIIEKMNLKFVPIKEERYHVLKFALNLACERTLLDQQVGTTGENELPPASFSDH